MSRTRKSSQIAYLMSKPILFPFHFLVNLTRVQATNLKLRSIPIRHKSFLEKKGSLRTSTLDKSGSVPSARRIIIRLTLKCQKIQKTIFKLISSQLQQKPVQYKGTKVSHSLVVNLHVFRYSKSTICVSYVNYNEGEDHLHRKILNTFCTNRSKDFSSLRQISVT